MKAVILAGGLGSRLSEETVVRPKPMVEIGGKPMLWHIMKIFSSHGIDEFVVCLGYKGYVIKEYFANYFLHTCDVSFQIADGTMEIHRSTAEPWRVTLVETGEQTMTGGRLKRVLDYVRDEDFCFTYGDGLTDMDISALIAFHRAQGTLATVTAVQPPGRFGALEIGGDRVRSFREKLPGDGGWMNGGFFVLSPQVGRYLEGDDSVWEREPVDGLARDGQLACYRHEGFWQAMDTLRERNQLEALWASGAAPLEDLAVIDPAFWRGRRVLLTGHTGFKGAWLALWLGELGARVTGLSDRVPTDPSLFELARVAQSAQDVRLDIRDHAAVAVAVAAAQPEIVIHMAAQSLVRESFAQPRETYATNVMGTVNLLEAVRATGGVHAVVVITSDKCYENREWEWGYREEESMGGFDPYSSSKGCAELVTDAYRRSFFSEPGAAAVASARAGNVIGGGDWAPERLLPDIMAGALAGEPIRVRNPDAVRPWQHVLNPLSGYLLLAQGLCESPALATAWNFGPPDEDAQPVRELVQRVGELWPAPLRWELEPGPHLHEAAYLKLDSSRARTRLHWRPPVALSRALESTVQWYRELQAGADMRAITLRQIAELAT